MNHAAFQLTADVSLFREGELFLGGTQLKLLKQVEKDGSIRTAALNLKMSYQYAWHMLERINRLSPVPVVVRQKGGKDGGGCRITPFGLKLMRAFEKRVTDVCELLSDSDTELERCFF
jgi:molybdate transport system regulatory protein